MILDSAIDEKNDFFYILNFPRVEYRLDSLVFLFFSFLFQISGLMIRRRSNAMVEKP
jgi:hypothetical protein